LKNFTVPLTLMGNPFPLCVKEAESNEPTQAQASSIFGRGQAADGRRRSVTEKLRVRSTMDRTGCTP
jgi:hypothetical protein